METAQRYKPKDAPLAQQPGGSGCAGRQSLRPGQLCHGEILR